MMSRSEAGKLGWLKSKEFFRESRLLVWQAYDLNPAQCEKCQVALSYKKRNNKFCGHSCAAKTSNVSRADIVNCLECGKPAKTKKFCSHSCRGWHGIRTAVESSEQGIVQASAPTYRKFMIRVHGAKCMKCSWAEKNPVTKAVPIQLNHIDGNSEHTKLKNVELLCPNCHSLTPNFGALNRGNGRHSRRQRYKEGKSS